MSDKNKGDEEEASGDGQTHTLCGTQGCCPTVTFPKEGGALLTDDFGGKVTLNNGQLAALKDLLLTR